MRENSFGILTLKFEETSTFLILEEWESEHLKMLSEIAPEEFDIKHYMALVELQVRKKQE